MDSGLITILPMKDFQPCQPHSAMLLRCMSSVPGVCARQALLESRDSPAEAALLLAHHAEQMQQQGGGGSAPTCPTPPRVTWAGP